MIPLIVALIFSALRIFDETAAIQTGTIHVSKQQAEQVMEDWLVATLNRMMKTVNAGDAKGYASLYAPNAVITIYGGGRLGGRDAIEQYEVQLLREFPGTRLAFYSAWQKGTRVVVHYGVNGPPNSAGKMGHEGLLFYTLDERGTIAEEHRYMDAMTPMAQMGLLGTLPARPVPTLPVDFKMNVAGSTSEEDKNVGIVKVNLAAMNSKNDQTFLATIVNDAIFDEMIFPRAFKGKRDVKTWLDTWRKTVPDVAFEVRNIFGAGEFVLAETVLRGTLTGTLGPVTASNKRFTVHRGVIVQMKDGRISRSCGFMNAKELAVEVGQWPPPGARQVR